MSSAGRDSCWNAPRLKGPEYDLQSDAMQKAIAMIAGSIMVQGVRTCKCCKGTIHRMQAADA